MLTSWRLTTFSTWTQYNVKYNSLKHELTAFNVYSYHITLIFYMKMESYLKYLLRFNHLYKKKSWKREEFKNNCTLEENFIKMSSYLCLVWWQSKLLSSSLVLQWWLSEPFFLPVTLSFDKFLQLFCWLFLCTKKNANCFVFLLKPTSPKSSTR